MKFLVCDTRFPTRSDCAWPLAGPDGYAGQHSELRLQGSRFKGVRLKVSVTRHRCRPKAAFRARPERRLRPAGVGVTEAFNHTRFRVGASHRNLRPNL